MEEMKTKDSWSKYMTSEIGISTRSVSSFGVRYTEPPSLYDGIKEPNACQDDSLYAWLIDDFYVDKNCNYFHKVNGSYYKVNWSCVSRDVIGVIPSTHKPKNKRKFYGGSSKNFSISGGGLAADVALGFFG